MQSRTIVSYGALLACALGVLLSRRGDGAPSEVQPSDPGTAQPAARPRTEPSARAMHNTPAAPPPSATSRQIGVATRAAPRVHESYSVPRDPAELAKRFFGADARAIASKWAQERASSAGETVANTILSTFSEAGADEVLRDVDCRETLCRLQVDRNAVMTNVKVNKKLAGKLGANGWLLDGAADDELLAFVPMDFQSL